MAYKLAEFQLQKIAKWNYRVVDQSISGPYLNIFWDDCLYFLPITVAPNVVTLIGLLINLVIWSVAEYLYADYLIPIFVLCYVIILTLDGIDGKQARKIKNSTPVGELFDHTVDLVTVFVMTRITSIIFNVQHQNLLAIYVLFGALFCAAHYKAYCDGYLTIPKYGGPNELLCVIIILYATDNYINWGIIMASPLLYVVSIIILIGMIIVLYIDQFGNMLMKKINIDMLLVLVILLFAIFTNDIGFAAISNLQIVCMCLIVNVELIIAKMASMHTRSYIIVLCGISLYSTPVAIVIASCTIGTMFHSIKDYLQIPFLTTFDYETSTYKKLKKTGEIN